MAEQDAEPQESDDSGVQESDSEGRDLGGRVTEYIKKSGKPDHIETRESRGRG